MALGILFRSLCSPAALQLQASFFSRRGVARSQSQAPPGQNPKPVHLPPSQQRPPRSPMANANPILEALVDDLAGRLRDADAVQRAQRNVDLVRAELDEYAALRAEAAADLAQARRRLTEATFNATAARLAALEPPERLSLESLLEDPEVAARAAAFVEAGTRLALIKRNELLLVQALGFLLAFRALAFALSRVRLLPGVLVAAAAAYALAYDVSRGAVVPGHTSILWIAVLVLCFLFGVPVVGNLP